MTIRAAPKAYSLTEAAHVLGIKYSTLASRLNRARKKGEKIPLGANRDLGPWLLPRNLVDSYAEGRTDIYGNERKNQ